MAINRYSEAKSKLFWPTDLPNVEELTSAGLIDTGNIDASIFGTGKFFKEQINEKKENIYSNIDDMLNQTLKDDE